MMIQYVLTKAEWDDYHEANHILAKIKAILSTSGIYNHELSIPAMTMYLVAKNDELNAAHKTLKEVTEQRDRLAATIKKLKELPDTWRNECQGNWLRGGVVLQLADDFDAAVKGGSDE